MVSFENKLEVLNYIVGKKGLFDLYEALPLLIQKTFTDTPKVHLSIFKDDEENWSNLRVEIESYEPLDKLFDLENQLFSLMEEDGYHVEALKYVTISMG